MSQQDSLAIEMFWNLKRLKFKNRNDAKIVDVWNVKQRHGPKCMSANYGLEPSNDSVGVMRRCGVECKENRY